MGGLLNPYTFHTIYDAAGRMVKVKNNNGQTLTTYTYGESRERLITQEGNENSSNRTYYAWEGGAVISEYVDINNALQWTKNYIYMSGALIATQEKTVAGEKVQFDHPDQLGIRLITDPGTGTSFEQASLPFGTALESESTGGINQRFTSYDRSATNGLDYAINRFYDSNQGRFTQVDPIGMASTSLMNPQSLNLYAYTENDPINKTDSNGLDGTPSAQLTVNWIWGMPGRGTDAGRSIWTTIFGPGFWTSLFQNLLGGGSGAGFFIHTSLNTGVDTNMTATYGLPGIGSETIKHVGAINHTFSKKKLGGDEDDDEDDDIIYVYTFERKSWFSWFKDLFRNSSGDRPGFPVRTPVNDLSKLNPEIANCITKVVEKFGKEFKDVLDKIKDRETAQLSAAVGGGTVVGFIQLIFKQGSALATAGGTVAAGSVYNNIDHHSARIKYAEKLKRCGVYIERNKGKYYYRRVKEV